MLSAERCGGEKGYEGQKGIKMAELKPCPFCGANLIHIYGKRVNRYYMGEPTLYEHPPRIDCVLGRYGKTINVRENDVKAWNRRAEDDK